MAHDRPKPKLEEEKGECAPLWIISFADMISLLMAFFVMLLTMSSAQSGKLCNEGEGIFEKTLYGFRRSIEGFGMPGLFGSADDPMQFDSSKVYYPINEGGDRGVTRTIDASEERIRRDFTKLAGRTRTYEAQIQGQSPNFIVLPVAFAQGQSALNESARQTLNRFLADLKGFGSVEGLTLYVVGLAPDEPDPQQQWLLSALRADAAAQFLRSGLGASAGSGSPTQNPALGRGSQVRNTALGDPSPSPSRSVTMGEGSQTRSNEFGSSNSSSTGCRLFSWGAAAGGDWVKKDSPISAQAQIAIATLRPNK
jgi:outer membrane protein OmpA-like peptidoglycan-associated protein